MPTLQEKLDYFESEVDQQRKAIEVYKDLLAFMSTQIQFKVIEKPTQVENYTPEEKYRQAFLKSLGFEGEPKESFAYRLGYCDGLENTHLLVPINSFQKPEIQAPDYVRGWVDGRSILLANSQK